MRSNDDNRKFAYAAFQALQLPKTWKLEGTDTVRTETDDPDSEILYVGAVYMDLSTIGIKLKRYRVFYNTHSERLGIVEKAIEDFGKYLYSCLASNKSIAQLNEFISETFSAQN